MSRISKFALCAALIMSLLMQTACADMRDINERAYVIGVGADPSPNGGWLFTFCCYLPRLPGASVTGEKMTTAIISCEAQSMAEAVRQLDRSTSRETVMEQLACIAVGSHPDGDGLLRLLDHALREPQVRRQAVVVAAEGSARELMSVQPDEGSAPAAIASLLTQQDGGKAASSDALYRVGQLLADGCDLMLRRVAAVSDGGDKSDSDAQRRLTLDGADCYSGGRYRGSLDEQQAELSGLLRGGSSEIMLCAQSQDGGQVYYSLRPVSGAVTVSTNGDSATFDISLRVEYSAADLGAGTAVDRSAVNEALLRQLEQLAVLSRRELGSAPLGLETAARQQQSRWYAAHHASWRSDFAGSVIRLHVDCTPATGQTVDIQLERYGE